MFYTKLSEIGKSDLLFSEQYIEPSFIKEESVIRALEDIVKNNKRVFVYSDYDYDGYTALEIILLVFHRIGFENFEYHKYSNRTHKIDQSAINKAIRGNFDYMIICDAGTSEMSSLKRLLTMGIKPVVLDHHRSIYSYEDYEDGIVVLNTSLEERESGNSYNLSAGALVYIIFEKLLKRLGYEEMEELSALALTSLYADCMDMSDKLNRSIYYKAVGVDDTKLPKNIQHFMGNYDNFNRKFIEFRLVPKINSLFRSESFDLLNSYIDRKSTKVWELVEKIGESHKRYRTEISKASDIIEYKVLKNFVIGNLSSVVNDVDIPEDKLHNYTGLVANQLASKYNRTAIVYADAGIGIKCSLRDLFGRNYLELFRQFCKAEGHNSAFGIHLDYLEFSEFISYLELIDGQYFITEVENKPLVVDHNLSIPDRNLIYDMALYNEFSGVSSPVSLISKVWLDSKNPYDNGYFLKYKWGDFYILSNNRVRQGSTLLIKPYLGWKTELSVYESR